MGCTSWRRRRSLTLKMAFSASSMTFSTDIALVVGQGGDLVGGGDHPAADGMRFDHVPVGLGVAARWAPG